MARIPEQRMAKAHEQLKNISPEDHSKLKAIASMVRPLRSFIFKTPDDYGMTGWHDLVIPSDDGTRLRPGISRPRAARARRRIQRGA